MSAAWLGVFTPDASAGAIDRCGECTTAKVTQRAGTLRVLTPGDGAPAAGDVFVINPLIGAIVRGHIDGGRVQLPWYLHDARDFGDGAIVLPATTQPRVMIASAAEVAAIRAALFHSEALAGMPRSAKIEVAAIDADGDGRADFALTYGCTGWGDGVCQAHGQIALARRGARWEPIE